MSSENPCSLRPRSPVKEHADTHRQHTAAAAEDLSKLTPNEIRARINAIDDERDQLRSERNRLSEALDVILSRDMRQPPDQHSESQ